ncbi:hypothetical protein [Streptomyces sp. NPDC048521]|uniref:hypothetical protein n=1 Tax=Streptomyces sp. NPDC048521 TaxID=3365566 RepID=UPI003716DE45
MTNLTEDLARAQAELADIKQEMTNYVMVPPAEYELLRPTGLADELNRIGAKMASRRIQAAEAVAWQALNLSPFENETARQFADRIRFYAERNHPELIIRFEHSRIEVYKLADFCGCDPNAEDYDDQHAESDEDGRSLCDKGFLGYVCGNCENEDGDGPDWNPDRYEWPCPSVAALDKPTQAPAQR